MPFNIASDATRIAYTVTGDDWKWDTWLVEVTGGTPQLMLRNANALRWTRDGRVLFSEFKTGSQLAIAVAGEGRRDQRDVYVPPLNGMAHYSDLSPDGTNVLIGEMIGSRTRTAARTLLDRLLPRRRPIESVPGPHAAVKAAASRRAAGSFTLPDHFAALTADGQLMATVTGALSGSTLAITRNR